MSRGSKVFRPTDLPESNSSGYPAPFRDGQRKRWNRRLGDHGGLKNYGVNFHYTSRPNWNTYANLLAFAAQIRRDLHDLHPRDMIDLQSFIWVQGSTEYD